VAGGARLTLTARDEAGEAAQAPRAFLFLALDGRKPQAPVARFTLEGTDQVTIGRGERPPARSRGVLRLSLDDPYVSTTHATLRRGKGGWHLEDSSKNGTLVDGRRVDDARLSDGAVIEIGGAFFVLRDGMAVDPTEARDVHSDELTGLTTLLPGLQRTFDQVERIARSAVPLVLRGETGTGKEVVARAVHRLSRRPGPFVAVNCAALAPSLVESELFGYRKGAFSGALEDRAGLVRGADRGTLLLDEIGDLPLPAQATLLRVLQEREVLPVGGTTPIGVDLRVIAASHLDLRALVATRRFRGDLEARLAGLEVELPPLRQRKEDLGLLVAAILARAPGGAGATLERAAARALFAHDWPKNIRELEQALTSALVLSGGEPIAPAHLPPAVTAARPRKPPPREGDPVAEELARKLDEHHGNVSAIARAMGKTRKQIQRWLKRFGMDAGSYRDRG
jgi:DNA-binding NtrC family response regulator